MKLLWLAHDGNMSGANVCLIEFLQLCQEMGFENHLIIPRDGAIFSKASPFVAKIHPVKFYSWNWPKGSSPSAKLKIKRYLRNKKAVNDIKRIIAQIAPDYVVSNTVVTPVAALAARQAGKKHIWIIHEFGEEDHGYIIGGGFSKAAKKINNLSEKIAFISQAVRAKYKPFVPQSKQFFLYNAFLGLKGPVMFSDNGIHKMIMLGQIAPAKNQLEAIQAIKLCRDQGIPLQLNIVGKADEPDYKEILENYIAKEKLQDIVKFGGTTNHPDAVLAQHELLLMCSRSEAFGRVTVEALQCGLPVIGASSGATPEIIQDGVNGYLYQAGNCNDLAAKIKLYVSTKTKFDHTRISTEAREKYSAVHTTEQLLALFN